MTRESAMSPETMQSDLPILNGASHAVGTGPRDGYRLVLLGAAFIAMTGCVPKRSTYDGFIDPAEAVGQTDAAPDNTILAVGGTAQLSVAVLSLTGAPLTTLDSIAYRPATASDSATVRVSPTGLVTGVAPASNAVPVNVVVFRAGTFNGDQVLVQVTPTPSASGLTLSIQPPLGDSAKLSMGTVKTITPVLRNPTTGQSVTGIQIQYAVLPVDLNRVGVFRGGVQIRNLFNAATVHNGYNLFGAGRNQVVPWVGEGTAWVYANVNAYGTLLRDSVQYAFTYPYVGKLQVTKNNLAVMTTMNSGNGISTATNASINPDLTLASGATITFSNGLAATDPLTVVFTFDNPDAATVASSASTTGGASGNVTTLIGGQSSSRRFLTPGTYHWTRVASGGPAPWSGQTASGAIVIR